MCGLDHLIDVLPAVDEEADVVDFHLDVVNLLLEVDDKTRGG